MTVSINTPTPTPPPSPAPLDHNPSAPSTLTGLAHDGFKAAHSALAVQPGTAPALWIAGLIGLIAVALLVVAIIRRNRQPITWIALALIAGIVAIGTGALGGSTSGAPSAVSAPSSSQVKGFEKWAEKTYSVKLNDASATRLLDGDATVLEQFGLRTTITAAADTDGRLYLFNANGSELGRTSGPGVINAVPDGTITGGSYTPGDN